MYTNGFKALEDEIRAAIKAKGIEKNIVLHIHNKADGYYSNYSNFISVLSDQNDSDYKFIGIQRWIDVPFNKLEHNTRIYSSETLEYDLFDGIMVWFSLSNLYYITGLKLINTPHKSIISKRTPRDYIPYIQSISVEKKPYTFFKNDRKLIVKFAINKWQNLNNQYKELLLKQPEESIKNYNNFLYLQKNPKKYNKLRISRMIKYEDLPEIFKTFEKKGYKMERYQTHFSWRLGECGSIFQLFVKGTTCYMEYYTIKKGTEVYVYNKINSADIKSKEQLYKLMDLRLLEYNNILKSFKEDKIQAKIKEIEKDFTNEKQKL